MARPYSESIRESRKQGRAIAQFQIGGTVLTSLRPFHESTERAGNPLQPVANTQNGNAQRKYARVAGRSICVIYRRRSARQYDACGFVFSYLREWNGAGQDGGEHLLLTNAPSDQLRILSAEIENDDAATFVHEFNLRRYS